MQTSRDTGITLAGTQVPLLREDQIIPGVLMTGVAMTYVWEVHSIERGHVLIKRLPTTTTPCHADAHMFAPYQRGQVCSSCGIRKQSILEFLPKREGKARVHLITPRSTVLRPQPYTVYGFLLPNGTAQTVHVTGDNWSQLMPIIPELGVVWSIPESLRAMVKGMPAVTTAEPQF